MSKLNEMWARFEKHQAVAESKGYGAEWQALCEKRDEQSALAAEDFVESLADMNMVGQTLAWASVALCESVSNTDKENYAACAINSLNAVESSVLQSADQQ